MATRRVTSSGAKVKRFQCKSNFETFARVRLYLLLLGCALLSGCAAATFALRPSPQAFEDDSDVRGLALAVQRSLSWLRTQDPARVQRFGPLSVSVTEHLAALEALAAFLQSAPSSAALAGYVDAHFVAVQAAGPVTFTGYYEPELEGSLQPRAGYDTPIYGAPPDLLSVSLGDFSAKLEGQHLFGRVEGTKLVPYHARGAFPETQPVLAWAKDPVDLFFAEIQGSARLRLPDGSLRRIGYAAKNGRPYRAIGALLIAEGHVRKEDMSMQAIRAWLARHPEERDRVLAWNESVVFFRLLEGEPLGALGVEVTPGRSIATDLALTPRAALAFVRFGATHRFVLNQDTGGAIKGPRRVDVFYGPGAEAAEIAGHLHARGDLWLLAPRSLVRIGAGGAKR